MYLEDMIGPILIGAAILVVLILFFTFVPLRLYISALAAGVKAVSYTHLDVYKRQAHSFFAKTMPWRFSSSPPTAKGTVRRWG